MSGIQQIVSPHTRKLKDHERRKALGQITGEEMHQISCPLCLVGAAVITVKSRSGGAKEFPVKDPVKCETCGKYFMLRAQVKITGVPLPDGS